MLRIFCFEWFGWLQGYLTVTIPLGIFQPKCSKMLFLPFNEFQTEQFFKGPPLKFQVASFGLLKDFLGQILLPNFTRSEPKIEILKSRNHVFQSETIHISSWFTSRNFQNFTVMFLVRKCLTVSWRNFSSISRLLTIKVEIGMFLCVSLLFKHRIQLTGVYLQQHWWNQFQLK